MNHPCEIIHDFKYELQLAFDASIAVFYVKTFALNIQVVLHVLVHGPKRKLIPSPLNKRFDWQLYNKTQTS